MTTEIVNLRQARKQRARTGREQQAEANRRLFGRTKSERRHDAAQKELDERRLSGARLDGDEPEDTPPAKTR
jgi:hypothetical protein